MIVTFGGRFGGYGLFVQDGKPVFVYNLLDLERFRWEGGVGGIVGKDLFGKALKPGQHTIVFDFKYAGPGPGKGGTGVLSVDGLPRAGFITGDRAGPERGALISPWQNAGCLSTRQTDNVEYLSCLPVGGPRSGG